MAIETNLLPPRADDVPLVDRRLVIGWFSLSLVWTILGPGIGLLAAMKLDDPSLLPFQEWLQFGRLRIAHVNAVIFLTFSPAMFGFMCYAVPRLCARPLWGARAAWVALGLNAAVAFTSPIAVLLGHIQFIEAGEQHLVADVVISAIFVLMTSVVLMTVVHRREPKLYVSLWYWIAALVWTVLNYPLGNFVLPYVPTGVTSAEMNGFYLHAVVGLWITPAGVGAAYYLVPVATRAVLYSHRLSLVGFCLMLGGMIGPIVQADATTQTAKSEAYPSFFMAGIMMEPMAAVSAAADPDTPEKMAADTMETCASPPRTCPTRAFAKLTSRSSTSVVSRSIVPGMRSRLKRPVRRARRSAAPSVSSSGRRLGVPAASSAAGTS